MLLHKRQTPGRISRGHQQRQHPAQPLHCQGRSSSSMGPSPPEDDRPAAAALKPLNVSLDAGVDILAGSRQLLLRPDERVKLDIRPDSLFHQQPRMAHHTDEGFRTRLADLYRQHLKPGSRVLDLGSSFCSHLPPELPLAEVSGLGLNQVEMQANPALQHLTVLDLNEEAVLPYAHESFDAVLCCCCVMYLQHPEAVASEMLRCLAPGGVALLSFSTHYYPDKAIVGWIERSPEERLQLVRRLMEASGFQAVEAIQGGQVPQGGGSSGKAGDPFYAVVATKSLQPMRSDLAEPRGAGARLRVDGSTNALAMDPDPDLYPAGLGLPDAARLSERYVTPALKEIELLSPQEGQAATIASDTLERWSGAYRAMAYEAHQLGIPERAIPELPDAPSAEEIRQARDHLQAMIASFMSAGL